MPTAPAVNRATAIMKKASRTPASGSRMGSRTRTSIAPRPSTANTALAAAEGLRSASQRLRPGLGAQFAGQPVRVAKGFSHLGLAAAGRRAVGEVALVVGGDVVDGLGRQAGEAVAQPVHEYLAGHWRPPRMSFTAAEKADHSVFWADEAVPARRR